MTKYLWVDSIAEKWGVSKSWVYRLCRDGRVSGAFYSEGRWSIPEDAEKPVDYRIHKRYISALSACKQIPLPEALPLKFPGEPDRTPDDTAKVMSECADYVLELVDVHPESGKLLFCALSYEHINACVVCENRFQYSYFKALKDRPNETFRAFSMMTFEYSMLTPNMRKSYFDEKKRLYNEKHSRAVHENAALILFIAGANGQRIIDVDRESGLIRSEYKKNSVESFATREDIKALSSVLRRAKIYKNAEDARKNMTFSEYSALHLSDEQYSERQFSDLENRVERLIII